MRGGRAKNLLTNYVQIGIVVFRRRRQRAKPKTCVLCKMSRPWERPYGRYGRRRAWFWALMMHMKGWGRSMFAFGDSEVQFYGSPPFSRTNSLDVSRSPRPPDNPSTHQLFTRLTPWIRWTCRACIYRASGSRKHRSHIQARAPICSKITQVLIEGTIIAKHGEHVRNLGCIER